MAGDAQVLLWIAGVHLLGLACVGVLLIPALRDNNTPPVRRNDGDSDDGGGGGPKLPPAPPTPPALVQSRASFIPEVGGSITTARKSNVDSLAVQIVSMMEKPWELGR